MNSRFTSPTRILQDYAPPSSDSLEDFTACKSPRAHVIRDTFALDDASRKRASRPSLHVALEDSRNTNRRPIRASSHCRSPKAPGHGSSLTLDSPIMLAFARTRFLPISQTHLSPSTSRQSPPSPHPKHPIPVLLQSPTRQSDLPPRSRRKQAEPMAVEQPEYARGAGRGVAVLRDGLDGYLVGHCWVGWSRVAVPRTGGCAGCREYRRRVGWLLNA